MHKKWVRHGLFLVLLLCGIFVYFNSNFQHSPYEFSDPSGQIDRSVAAQITRDMAILYEEHGYRFFISVLDTSFERFNEKSAQEYFNERTSSPEEPWFGLVFLSEGTLYTTASPELQRRIDLEELEIHKSMSRIEAAQTNVSRGLYHFFINAVDLIARYEGVELATFLTPSRDFFAMRLHLRRWFLFYFLSAGLLLLFMLLWQGRRKDCLPEGDTALLFGGVSFARSREKHVFSALMEYRKTYDSSAILLEAEAVTKQLVEHFGDTLVSVVLVGNDALLNRLAGNKPLLLVVTSSWGGEHISTLDGVCRSHGVVEEAQLLFLEESELSYVRTVYPLDFLYTQERAHLLWGQDLYTGIELSHEEIRTHLLARCVQTVSFLRRAEVCKDMPALVLLYAMQQYLIIFRGILYLRGIHKYTEWSWIVSVVESSCSIKDSSFSEAVAAVSANRFDEAEQLVPRLIAATRQTIEKIREM
ncbi:hypothetical protein [Chitinivibrio alkaliphilus]|uniref:Uncharacterized protein n=1 Tax=Chitinivibrio alkaliphilus ACht1 TaxID=1313304 RepID=U7D9N9_9BACT|nr:hypothetical protein [Chitinivibrio alkaliphilus]ERP39109.1 hypothetical protein CALK_0275 [Chitinivibrio alkaliphilus ACht1]